MLTRQLIGDEIANDLGRTFVEGVRPSRHETLHELYDSDLLTEGAPAILNWFGISGANELKTNGLLTSSLDERNHLDDSPKAENQVVTVGQVIVFLEKQPDFAIERIVRIALANVAHFDDLDAIQMEYRIREGREWMKLYGVLKQLLQSHQRSTINKTDWKKLGKAHAPTLQMIIELAEEAQLTNVEN